MKRIWTAAFTIIGALAVSGCNDATLAAGPPKAVPPVAVLTSAASSYFTLDTATIDGSNSYDPDNDAPDAIREYKWSLLSTPAGSSTAIAGAATANVFVDVAGTYEVQLIVVDQDGLQSQPAVFLFEGIPFDDLHVELAWDIDVSDVDLHLVNGTNPLFSVSQDCFFGNCVPGVGGSSLDWGPAGPDGDPTLDIDDIEGYGPENANIEKPTSGATYRVAVHYWSDDNKGPTTAKVKIYVAGQLKHEATQLLQSTGKAWDVATISWPSGAVTPLNNTYNCDPYTVALGGTC